VGPSTCGTLAYLGLSYRAPRAETRADDDRGRSAPARPASSTQPRPRQFASEASCAERLPCKEAENYTWQVSVCEYIPQRSGPERVPASLCGQQCQTASNAELMPSCCKMMVGSTFMHSAQVQLQLSPKLSQWTIATKGCVGFTLWLVSDSDVDV
jgi:hypothetical protein